MTPTVLLYNFGEEKSRNLKVLCLTLKLRVRSVPAADFGQTLNAVLGISPKVECAEEGQPFGDEMMVMAGLSSQQMNALLQGMRRKKIPPVKLKAVLTAANSQWNGYQLYQELQAEHQAMLRGENLHEGESL